MKLLFASLILAFMTACGGGGGSGANNANGSNGSSTDTSSAGSFDGAKFGKATFGQ